MRHDAILLPGGVLPADLAYGDLIEALGDDIGARSKDLEIYSAAEPPPDYGLETEIDAVLRKADAAGFERFHLVGYSAGGAISIAFVARAPERILSVSLLEPAWIGDEGQSEAERKTRVEFGRLWDLPPDQMMLRFVRIQLAPGVEPPAPPAGPPPAWMAKRPAGLRALIDAFERYEVDPAALQAFARPVYYALGALSNQDLFGEMADRLKGLFRDYTLEVYEGRHHFDPPHRAEPDRLASRLRGIWDRGARPVLAGQ
jgi:pimeloyl-ACP methyl ester carboxylesterase